MAAESEEWTEYFFEQRHAHRVRKLEKTLFLPTILIHVANVLFLKTTKWTSNDAVSNASPHAPRYSFTRSSFSDSDISTEYDNDPVIFLYVLYIFSGGIALICFSVTKLFSPTLNKGMSNEAITIIRCRNEATVTIFIMLIVLPVLYKVHPTFSILLMIFLLYKLYVVTVFTNYVRILKVQGTYQSNTETTYPIDRPVSMSTFINVEEDEDDVDCATMVQHFNNNTQQSNAGWIPRGRSSVFMQSYDPNTRKISWEDPPPTYEQATNIILS